jgi:hypothetical protein
MKLALVLPGAFLAPTARNNLALLPDKVRIGH